MRRIPLLAAVLLLLFVGGCYTVLHHPAEIAKTEPAGTVAEGSGEAPCSECHYESEWLGFFDHELIYGWPGLLAVDRNDWWFDYYRRPWWWDGSWYDHAGSETSGGAEGEPSWRKRILKRADDPAPQAGPSGVFPGGAPSSASGETTPASPSADSGGGEKKAREPEPSHRKKDPRR